MSAQARKEDGGSSESGVSEAGQVTLSLEDVLGKKEKLPQDLSKAEVEDLIKSSSSRISLTENTRPSVTSKVWAQFRIVLVDEKPVDFVKCVKCAKVYRWTSRLGTKSLNEHFPCPENAPKVLRPTSASIRPLDSFMLKPRPSTGDQKLNKDIVTGFALDLMPLSTVMKRGFRLIAQSLINYGARNGPVNVEDALFHRTKLQSSSLPSVVGDVKDVVTKNIQNVISKGKYAFTFDMWSEKYRKRYFLSLSIHFIDKDFRLHCYCVEEMPPGESHTTAVVRRDSQRILRGHFEEEEVTILLKNAYSVTDGGSNVVSVFDNRLPCECHKLNNFMERVFAEEELHKVHPEVNATFVSSKKLVTYFKQSGLNARLKTTLKQANSTRWNSHLTLFESIVKSYADVCALLSERHQEHRIDKIDMELVKDVVNFLQIFRSCTEAFSKDKMPTFQIVCRWFHKIWQHIQPKDDDSEWTTKVKAEALKWFPVYLDSEPIHYAACMLDPRYKRLKWASDLKRDQGVRCLKNLMNAAEVEPSSSSMLSLEPSAPKKVKRPSFFDDMRDSDDEGDEAASGVSGLDSELSAYLELSSREFENVTDDSILDWWKNLKGFPRLKSVASWLLAIPASSTTDERVFSTTGATITPRRTNLGGSTLADLTFVNKNWEKN